VTGTIATRIIMGTVCDWLGPRLGMSVVLLTCSPCVYGLALANKAIDFIMLRFGIGFVLSVFVACQFWTSCMFNTKIVGALPRTPLTSSDAWAATLQKVLLCIIWLIVRGDGASLSESAEQGELLG
jgi:MFS transporter, NNP family, nitrate/nitrite transporter